MWNEIKISFISRQPWWRWSSRCGLATRRSPEERGIIAEGSVLLMKWFSILSVVYFSEQETPLYRSRHFFIHAFPGPASTLYPLKISFFQLFFLPFHCANFGLFIAMQADWNLRWCFREVTFSIMKQALVMQFNSHLRLLIDATYISERIEGFRTLLYEFPLLLQNIVCYVWLQIWLSLHARLAVNHDIARDHVIKETQKATYGRMCMKKWRALLLFPTSYSIPNQ